MPGHFYCTHCGNQTPKNRRLKTGQLYCGSPACQQSRKNRWEREKLKDDPNYKQRRKSQKDRWRENRPDHEYQMAYRQSHPRYLEINRKQQQIRNKKALETGSGFHFPNIVKTDALISERLVQGGLYEILPYKMRPGINIVKTDALIVEIRAHSGFPKVLVSQSG